MHMNGINQLFDTFAVAYQHSLYAIEQAEFSANSKRLQARANVKKKYECERSKFENSTKNDLKNILYKLNEVCVQMNKSEDTVIRAAEYLIYGKTYVRDLKRMSLSDTSIPCIIPFIGHGNIMLESNGDECYTVGTQFVLQALQQTAPGQLSITVINPELRPEFSVFTRLPEFQMLIETNEIKRFFANITEELVKIDSLLQKRYDSLVELRKSVQQPVERLRVIVIQDLPQMSDSEFNNQLFRILKGAPRAGIAILFLAGKNKTIDGRLRKSIADLPDFSIFKSWGNQWCSQLPGHEKFLYEFPVRAEEYILKVVSEIIEAAKKSSAVTIPFRQIEGMNQMWTEDSTENIIFNLGKSGLDTVSVCIGDKVTQYHNILILGAVGKGKSNLLEVMIHSLCWCYSPEELELYLLDFKDGLTFKPYADKEEKSWLPHARMLGLESDRDIGLAILRDLENERLSRAEMFGDAPGGGAKGYEDYRKKYPQNVIPRIVLVIDEYQKLFEINDDISEEAAMLLENLVRQGRACAIHVILASQSINGAAGLLGKEERIYAQFPVRIALQNTISESYALLGTGNDAAARLRIRGEAVINKNYGDVKSNQNFTVAYADPEETKRIRQEFCRKYEGNYPVIFSRRDHMDFSMVLSEVKKWRNDVGKSGIVRLLMGVRLSVKKDIISLPFRNDSGRNIAILGSAENLQKNGVIPGKNNIAIGMIQSICLALALQHPEGNARFVLIDGLSKDVDRNSNMHRWAQLMERFGFPVEFVAATEAVNWLLDFRQEMNTFGCDEDTYICCVGMDRYSDFSEMNLSGESGADVFQQLIKCGTKGVHFICWWSNVSTYRSHLGFGNDGYFGIKVLLRMDTDTSRDILGPFVTWGVRENRAYIHDQTELASNETVIPLMPMNNRICGIVESEVW